MSTGLHAYTFANMHEYMEKFIAYYGLEKGVKCSDANKTILKPITERVCRFCGRSSSETKFDEAHLIPSFLGNRNLFSDSECKSCNAEFGKYENDFAAFLGMQRTLLHIAGRSGVPTFNPKGGNVRVAKEDLYGMKDNILVSYTGNDVGNNPIKIDDNNGMTTVRAMKMPYRPFNLYRVLLKIAMSIIPDEYLIHYQRTIIKLVDKEDKVLSNFAKIALFEMINVFYEEPQCLLFRKIDLNDELITHVFALCYQNHFYSFPLPLLDQDIQQGLYDKNKQIVIPICPPVLSLPVDSSSNCRGYIKDLSSTDLVREEDGFTLSYLPSSFDKTKAYNIETGEIENHTFDPSVITKIIIGGSGSPTWPSRTNE